MVTLTDYEKAVLAGEYGRLRQAALENIVRYAEVLGAKELCKVTKAMVFCGKHVFLESCKATDFDDVFSQMELAVDERIVFDSIDPQCQVQSDVSPCDQNVYEPLGQTREFFLENENYLKHCKDAGVTIIASCAPYLNGWIPVRGEHFVTTESSVTILGNSLWGACCNSDGIEAAFWSSICGRTPKWGRHTPEGRIGTHRYHLDFKPDSIMEWDLAGKAIADKLPQNAVPVITGDFSELDFNKIRQFGTSLAVFSNCELFHLVGFTPESNTLEQAFHGNVPEEIQYIGRADLDNAYNSVCAPGAGKIGLVSLGCPHYDIQQIKEAANYLKGKTIHASVDFMIWTSYPIKYAAKVNGYEKIIEDAGGRIYTSTCPTTIGAQMLDKYPGMLYDSTKQCVSVTASVDTPSYFASMEDCIDAAVTGYWEGK